MTDVEAIVLIWTGIGSILVVAIATDIIDIDIF